MRQQRNRFQREEQGKISQDHIKEEEIGSLPEKECRGMIVKMIQDLRNTVEA